MNEGNNWCLWLWLKDMKVVNNLYQWWCMKWRMNESQEPEELNYIDFLHGHLQFH